MKEKSARCRPFSSGATAALAGRDLVAGAQVVRISSVTPASRLEESLVRKGTWITGCLCQQPGDYNDNPPRFHRTEERHEPNA
jgi:hypothetical protein